MTVEEKVYSLLVGSTLINVTASNRVYPLEAPQGVTLPYIVYNRSDNTPTNSFNGYEGLSNPELELDIYSTNYATLKTLGVNTRTVLNSATNFRALQTGEREFSAPDVRTNETVFRLTQDFSLWNRE